MDNKALYKLSYGVFMLGTKNRDKLNGCITNTAIQVANSPTRIAIAVINTNYTAELLKESGVFSLSLLDQTATFDTIKHFGMQSGRDVNKFENFDYATDIYGCPYLKSETCAQISAKVVDSTDLGSHTLFIAEIEDAQVMSDHDPLTYADYQDHVKPKPASVASDKKIIGWKCKICGYVYEGANLPKDYVCPLCGHPAEDFEPIYE